MNPKLLFYFDDSFYHFGIAEKLQDYDLYAIIDASYELASFFETQKMVSFKKVWNLRKESYNLEKEPDISYLKNIEKKYNFSLYQFIYADKELVQNQYYQFTLDQLLNILETECRFFERILKEDVKFLLIKTTDHHRIHLLYKMCNTANVIPLTLSPTRVGNRAMISTDFDKLHDCNNSNKIRNLDELRFYIENFNTSKQSKKRGIIQSKKKYPRDLLKVKENKFYLHFGKSYYRVLLKIIRNRILEQNVSNQRKKILQWLDENADRKLAKPFVYFPLHVEPERILTITQPYHNNQKELIANIAKSLPVDFTLYVKEHPIMLKAIKPRKISYYEQIQSLPNVKILHHSTETEEIYQNCSFVATIAGTSAVEAALHKKPSLIFADTSYSKLPFVYRVHQLEKLPHIIHEIIHANHDFSQIVDYVNTIDWNSFGFDLTGFLEEVRSLSSKLVAEVNQNEIRSFLDSHNNEFEKISNEYRKKIKNTM